MTKEDFLINLYHISGGDLNFHLNRDDLINEFKIDQEVFDKHAIYWVNKEILHGPSQTTAGSHLSLFFNSEGIDYVENNLLNDSMDSVNSKQSQIKIFISHKEADLELAKALVKLLDSALEIRKDDIRCTSVPGYKFDPGEDIIAAIRKEVNESDVLIGLLTPESLKSSYVLFELGARWGLKKHLIPLLANGADYVDLPAPIKQNNAIKLQYESDVYDLIDLISDKLNSKKQKTSSYKEELNNLVKVSEKKKNEHNGLQKTEVDSKKEKSELRKVIESDALEIELNNKRESILRSEEGVKLAFEASEDFYSQLEKECSDNSYKKSGIVFSIKQKTNSNRGWEAKLYTNGGSAFIEFKIPFSNSVLGFDQYEDAHIRIFVANYDLFDDYKRIIKDEQKSFEKYYYFTLNDSMRSAWSEEKRAEESISTSALVQEIFFEFYSFTKKFRSSF